MSTAPENCKAWLPHAAVYDSSDDLPPPLVDSTSEEEYNIPPATKTKKEESLGDTSSETDDKEKEKRKRKTRMRRYATQRYRDPGTVIRYEDHCTDKEEKQSTNSRQE